ncbi:MAG: hypothetical protein EOP49_12585 [Sphingobacteriales bacterium]|nr:MAG: hypothetical protein EOP49_12585 [Sphingobacteriales bacterium]
MEKRRNDAPTRGDNKERGEDMSGRPETPDSMSMDNSVSDEERLKQDTSYIIIPDVSDIPGQENITSAGIPGAMSDSTVSSDDEEGIVNGRDLLEDDDDVEIVMGIEADVTAEDLALLGDANQDLDGGDDELAGQRGLDDTDLDGELLNEAVSDTSSTGSDLDMPVADGSDPQADAMGQGDEENDYYSLGSDDNDNLTEGTP